MNFHLKGWAISLGDLLIVALEVEQALFELLKIGKVVSREHFTLHDREHLRVCEAEDKRGHEESLTDGQVNAATSRQPPKKDEKHRRSGLRLRSASSVAVCLESPARGRLHRCV